MHVFPWQHGRTYYPDASYEALIKRYSSWVYACADKNATSCSQVPLRLYAAKPPKGRKTGFRTRAITKETSQYLAKSPTVSKFVTVAEDVEEVLSHPFLDLLTNVNEYMNKFDLLDFLFRSLDIIGNCYWFLDSPSPEKPPTEIWPILGQYIKIVPHATEFVSHYEFFKTKADVRRFEKEEIIHFKYMALSNLYYGLGPLQAVIMAADLHLYMNQYETSLAKNRAVPDSALILPPEQGEPNDEEKKRLRTAWKKMFRGAEKSGGMAILHGGAKIEQVQLSPREMAFLQGRKMTREEIAGVFGVPLSKLITEDVNRANAEAGDYSYMKDTILPRLRRVEDKLNERLLPLWDSNIFVAFDNPVPRDKEFRIKDMESKLKTGYSNINEQRQIDGQAPVDWGETPILPAGMIPFGTSSLAIATEPVKTKAKKRKLPPLGQPTNFVDATYVRVLRDYYSDFMTAALKDFDNKKAVKDILSGWFDAQKWNKELLERTEPFLRATFITGAERALNRVSSEIPFDPLSGRAASSLENHRIGMVQSVNGTTVKRLRKSIADGITANESRKEIRGRITGIFTQLSRHQTETIARSETIWAWNEGAMQGYIQSGVVIEKQWTASPSERTCQWCSVMDGKIVDVDVQYHDKGGTFIGAEGGVLHFDFEAVEHPPLHPQCRCSIIPIIKEL